VVGDVARCRFPHPVETNDVTVSEPVRGVPDEGDEEHDPERDCAVDAGTGGIVPVGQRKVIAQVRQIGGLPIA
jgi:hypothetical protein